MSPSGPNRANSTTDRRSVVSASIFLSGPTAAGKTAVGLELAERLDAEIISLDSMALYRSLDIGTAKPTASERGRVRHHLLDLIEPAEEYSVAQYVAAAEQAVADITARGKTALFVGGTPLYLKALLRGIFQGPPADWELRGQLQAEARAADPGLLHARLQQVDPAAAARLHPQDERRLIRALEVFEKTGHPISSWQQQFEHARPMEDCRVFVLDWPRDELYGRINRRVEAMFHSGLVEEVLALRAAGITFSRTARQALGYREVLEHLSGERDLPATMELVQTRTRQFAKRQLTWFRSLSECRRIPITIEATLQQAAETILQFAR